MDEKSFYDERLDNIDTGQAAKVRSQVIQILEENPDNIKAWYVLVRVSVNPLEKIHALNNIIRLDPNDEWAKNALEEENLAHELNEKALKRADRLSKRGETQQAEYLIDFVLGRNPDFADAWLMKAKLSNERAIVIQALKEIIRINPEHKIAKKRLAQLISGKTDKKKKKIPLGYILLGVAGLLLICALSTTVLGPLLMNQQPTTIAHIPSNGEDTEILETRECQDVIDQAMAYSDISCQKIGSNQVCYGNSDIYTDLVEGVTDEFASVGDVIEIEKVKKLSASPLDMDNELWGIAIFKVPANLPGTLPGQNVTFIIFGDTAINNTSGNMTAFYFASGISGITCAEIPFKGIYIESQHGSGVAFEANGVSFVLKGRSILQAKPAEKLTVTLLEGEGQVSAEGQTQDIEAGSYVSVPLDWDLNPTGPPSEPESLTEEDTLMACHILGFECPDVEGGQATPTHSPGPLPTNTSVPAPTNTSVPISTGIPTNTPVPVPSGQPTITSVPLPTNTPVPVPTNTPVPLPTSTPTNTPTITPTSTLTPTATNTPTGPTNTPIPGATATNTPIPSNTPTNTPVPPTSTNTPVPTNTSTFTPVPPTATNTSVPTSTATPSICSDITTSTIATDDGAKTMGFKILNETGGVIRLDDLTIYWPTTPNGTVKEINLNGTQIYDTEEGSSPLIIPTHHNWKSGSSSDREIPHNQTYELTFLFQTGADPSPYTVNFEFNIGCPKTVSN